ncbi:trans-sialidase [Trypanosoma cruzi]|nr:trans-sialidase [Trypanosoma cruzi]
MNEESCAAFLVGILDVAPSTRLQYARMLRSMLEMNRTPLDMVILGIQKIAARSETKQTRPLTEEAVNESVYPQPNRLEATCCLTTCVDNGESLVRDCILDTQQFHTGAGRELGFWIGPWHRRRRGRIPTAPRGSSGYEGRMSSTL